MAEAEDRLRKALRSERGLTPFVGAGVSLAATGKESCASWKGLLLAGIESCESALPKLKDGVWGDLLRQKLKKPDLDDYLAVGSEISSRLKGVGRGKDFDTWIENTIGKLRPTDEGRLLIRAIRGLGSVILTTNYDSLLEDVDEKWAAIDWTEKEFPAAAMRSNVVLHLHGSKTNPRSVVLGSGEYEKLQGKLNRVLTESFFLWHTLAFIGCGDGLADPHLAMVLKFMSKALEDEEVEHFILVTSREHRKLTQHRLSDWITPIPYGDDYSELRPFLEELEAAHAGRPRTTQPEAGEAGEPHALEQATGLLYLAATAENMLRSALQALGSVKKALQQVESRRAESGGMAELNLEQRIREHQRLAGTLKESAALVDASAERLTPLAEEAYNRTWLLTQPEYSDRADELPQVLAAIAELETATQQLAVRIVEAHDDLVARCSTYSGYRDAADHLSHALKAVRTAHSRATSLNAHLGPAQTRQEPRRERSASQVTAVHDSEPADDNEPALLPRLRLAPILGEARGGSPRGVGQAGEEMIPVPPRYSRHNDVFAMQVNGMSLKGYGVLDGDYVTILRQEDYQDGDVVVAIFGGESADEAVVKVLRLPDKGVPYLESSDQIETEELQRLGEFTVQGKVVGLVRWEIQRVPRRRSAPPPQQPSSGA